MIYRPYLQMSDTWEELFFGIRTVGNPDAMAAVVRRELHEALFARRPIPCDWRSHGHTHHIPDKPAKSDHPKAASRKFRPTLAHGRPQGAPAQGKAARKSTAAQQTPKGQMFIFGYTRRGETIGRSSRLS
jgi:hypothetical protein